MNVHVRSFKSLLFKMSFWSSSLWCSSAVVLSLYYVYQRHYRKGHIPTAIHVNIHAPLIIVLDVGSSSIRATAFAYSKNQWHTIPNTNLQWKIKWTSMLNMESYLNSIDDIVSSCLSSLTENGWTQEITAVGISSFVMNWIGVDKTGSIVTPLMTVCRIKCRLIMEITLR